MTSGTDTDRARLLELHRAWNKANDAGDLDWLRAHIAPDEAGENRYVMYNTVLSNFYGLHGEDGILELWTRLRKEATAAGGYLRSTPGEPHLVVDGNLAVITYLLEADGDFGGEVGAFHESVRNTEVWRRIDSGWKMIHYHGSPREPGALGGE